MCITDKNYIAICDVHNNRIQVYSSQSIHQLFAQTTGIPAFGSWSHQMTLSCSIDTRVFWYMLCKWVSVQNVQSKDWLRAKIWHWWSMTVIAKMCLQNYLCTLNGQYSCNTISVWRARALHSSPWLRVASAGNLACFPWAVMRIRHYVSGFSYQQVRQPFSVRGPLTEWNQVAEIIQVSESTTLNWIRINC